MRSVAVRGTLAAVMAAVTTTLAAAQGVEATRLHAAIDRATASVMDSVVHWRRDFHQHPELSNREVRTSGIVAAHLRSLGLEVRTGVAHTGVVGVLRGGRPGPVVALRSDMDALPVTEVTGLPFASQEHGTYNGQTVGVMHACGHDLHLAILMGVADVLASMRRDLPGTVVFLFQPAEEGAPAGETGGAPLMVSDGALQNPAPSAVFGLHVMSRLPARQIAYKAGPLLASSDELRIVVHGRQTHGALPWQGVDPIVVASQIVLGLQTIVSRQIELTRAPAVITIGRINGGIRFNIIPDSVELVGTIRAFDEHMRRDIHDRIRRTATSIAQGAGATADVQITIGNDVTFNDSALVRRMSPTLQRVGGDTAVGAAQITTAAEDFSAYQKVVPGIFFFVGVTPKEADFDTVAANHSPRFFADESALPVGVRALSNMAVDYLLTGR